MSRTTGRTKMLKQILATSALIALTAVMIQSANAAGSGKFRQLVVEPSGSPAADPLIKKQKKIQTLVVQQGQGIQTPGGSGGASNGGAGGNKGAKFIIAPSQGIPTQTADAGNGKSNGKVAHFIVASGPGIKTPDGGNKGHPQNGFPSLA